MKEAFRSIQTSVRDSTAKFLYLISDEAKTVDEKFEAERSTFRKLKILLDGARVQAEKQQYMTEKLVDPLSALWYPICSFYALSAPVSDSPEQVGSPSSGRKASPTSTTPTARSPNNSRIAAHTTVSTPPLAASPPKQTLVNATKPQRPAAGRVTLAAVRTPSLRSKEATASDSSSSAASTLETASASSSNSTSAPTAPVTESTNISPRGADEGKRQTGSPPLSPRGNEVDAPYVPQRNSIAGSTWTSASVSAPPSRPTSMDPSHFNSGAWLSSELLKIVQALQVQSQSYTERQESFADQLHTLRKNFSEMKKAIDERDALYEQYDSLKLSLKNAREKQSKHPERVQLLEARVAALQQKCQQVNANMYSRLLSFNHTTQNKFRDIFKQMSTTQALLFSSIDESFGALAPSVATILPSLTSTASPPGTLRRPLPPEKNKSSQSPGPTPSHAPQRAQSSRVVSTIMMGSGSSSTAPLSSGPQGYRASMNTRSAVVSLSLPSPVVPPSPVPALASQSPVRPASPPATPASSAPEPPPKVKLLGAVSLDQFITNDNWVEGETASERQERENQLVCPTCENRLGALQLQEHNQYCAPVNAFLRKAKHFALTISGRDDSFVSVNVTNDADLERWFSLTSRNSRVRKLLIREGLPLEVRRKVWPVMVGSVGQRQLGPGLSYSNFLKSFQAKSNKSTEQIAKDLHRTFDPVPPEVTPQIIASMKNVLTVYSFLNPDVGYCQSMNFVLAPLIITLGEEDAFWALQAIIEERLPRHYYTYSLRGVMIDQMVFKSLLHLKFPKLSTHLLRLELDTNPIVMRWFMCLFYTLLTLQGSMRVMELFLLEGDKLLFRLGLAIFKRKEKDLLQCNDFADAFQMLLEPITDHEELIKIAFDISLKRGKIAEIRQRFAREIAAERGRASTVAASDSIVLASSAPEEVLPSVAKLGPEKLSEAELDIVHTNAAHKQPLEGVESLPGELSGEELEAQEDEELDSSMLQSVLASAIASPTEAKLQRRRALQILRTNEIIAMEEREKEERASKREEPEEEKEEGESFLQDLVRFSNRDEEEAPLSVVEQIDEIAEKLKAALAAESEKTESQSADAAWEQEVVPPSDQSPEAPVQSHSDPTPPSSSTPPSIPSPTPTSPRQENTQLQATAAALAAAYGGQERGPFIRRESTVEAVHQLQSKMDELMEMLESPPASGPLSSDSTVNTLSSSPSPSSVDASASPSVPPLMLSLKDSAGEELSIPVAEVKISYRQLSPRGSNQQ